MASESATFPTFWNSSRRTRLFPTIRAEVHSSRSSGRNGTLRGGRLLRHVPEEFLDAGEIERLGDELGGAGAGGARGDVGTMDRGHDEEKGGGLPRLDAFEHLDPLHPGHPDVDEGGGVRVLPQEGEGLLSVLGEVRGEPHPGDGLPENPADALVVVCDEDSFHVAAFLPGSTGRDSNTAVPAPGEERISIFPPSRVTACRAITRPSPVPRAFVV